MGGMTCLLLLLWAGVTVGSVVELQKRILGGHNCLNTERLYHVQLRTSYPDEFICGGSLISDRWILTAAHCWDLTLYAVVGVHPGTGTGPAKRTNVKVKPHFFLDKEDNIHDIMLLEIIKPDKTGIKHVKLPDKCENPAKIKTVPVVQIAGYANTTVDRLNSKKGTVESDKLLCANTDVVSCEDYIRCLKNRNPELWAARSHEHWLCYKRPGVDVSGGDSGGGVVDGGTIYGVIVLSNPRVCDPVKPAAAMEVCEYRDWIDKTIAISTLEKCDVAFKKLCCIS